MPRTAFFSYHVHRGGRRAFLLFGTSAVAVYVIAMAVWGFYYDLYEIGSLDFVEEDEARRAQTSSFGILNAFEGTGYLIARSSRRFSSSM